MRTSRFSAEQIVGILKEHEAGAGMAELCRRHGVSQQTFYRWRQKYGGLERSEAGRLKALEDSSDGFKIAEVDFELRGPGDVLGTKQHGSLPLRVASLTRDVKVLDEAREAGFDLVRTGEFDTPEFAPLKIRVLERFGRLMDLPPSG